MLNQITRIKSGAHLQDRTEGPLEPKKPEVNSVIASKQSCPTGASTKLPPIHSMYMYK
jgi:hypothetical protein